MGNWIDWTAAYSHVLNAEMHPDQTYKKLRGNIHTGKIPAKMLDCLKGDAEAAEIFLTPTLGQMILA